MNIGNRSVSKFMKFLRVAFGQKHRLLMLCLATTTMVGENVVRVPSSQAVKSATTNFTCSKFEGKPATVARTKKGEIPIVIWSSEGFSQSGFTPQVRCQKVSARFQMMYRSGQLKYITAGTVNNLPVICATKEIGNSCSQQNFLYTLKPNADPQQVIKRLTMIRNRATSRGLEESASFQSDSSSNSIAVTWLEEEN
jgi:hypothetical protein